MKNIFLTLLINSALEFVNTVWFFIRPIFYFYIICIGVKVAGFFH